MPVEKWACGHDFAEHTRVQAAACYERQRLDDITTADGAGASAPVATEQLATASDICTEAAQLVGGARQATHGDKSTNFANIADAWNAILKVKARQAAGAQWRLDAHDVANMLEALKIARRYSGTFNVDDYVDAASYAGCAGEIVAKSAARARD